MTYINTKIRYGVWKKYVANIYTNLIFKKFFQKKVIFSSVKF
jgi:hypothetical protein